MKIYLTKLLNKTGDYTLIYILGFIGFWLSAPALITYDGPLIIRFLVFLFSWFSLSLLIFALLFLFFMSYCFFFNILWIPYKSIVSLFRLRINIRKNLRLFIPVALGIIIFFAWLYLNNYNYVLAEQGNNQGHVSCNYPTNSLLFRGLCYIGLFSFTFFLTAFTVFIPLIVVGVPWLVMASIPIVYYTYFSKSDWLLVDDPCFPRTDEDNINDRQNFFFVMGVLWFLIVYCLVYVYFVTDPWASVDYLF